MDVHEEIAKRSNTSAEQIKSYREHFRGTVWHTAEKIAFAALLASNNIDEGDVEGFAGAYGNLTFNHLIEKEQQPGQGVTEINREILELLIEKHDELQTLIAHSESFIEADKD